jgi:radical SAM protein with 4Fe4S-binding SPASM domain
VTKKTYERVTRTPGSFGAFMQGFNLLYENRIPMRLKAMALRSNVYELPDIASFCRKYTRDYFRFDPFLHLRFDHSQIRNREIRSERLSPQEIMRLERSDPERIQALEKVCHDLTAPEYARPAGNHLFRCGIGNGGFTLSYNGLLRLCSSLWHPDCVYDLKTGSLTAAWSDFVPRVLDMRSERKEFLTTCRVCSLINLCMWCPAHAHLETGMLDKPVDYFCQVAHIRAAALEK